MLFNVMRVFMFPFWAMTFLIALTLFVFIFWVFAIVDCISSKLRPTEKLFWILVIVFFNLFGATLYFILSKSKKFKIRSFKGKMLLRSKKNRIIAGVCGGIGEYIGIDPTVIRLLWTLLTIFSIGIGGILVYIVAWIIIPEE